jgi:serine/threonine-protein kinase
VTRFVALKRMLPHLCSQPSFVAMFLDEARLVSRLSHQNIVHINDFGAVNGQYFLAMEYLTGEPLNVLVRKVFDRGQRVPVGVALLVISQVCDGLHYAHTLAAGGKPLRIVHRDISHANILLTYQGGVKIIDFGIARAADRQQETTGQGTFKGTLAYASPEQVRGEAVDAQSDVFAIGVVLYELLAGRRLFKRDNQLATVQAVLSDSIPPLELMNPGLPRGIDAVLQRALARSLEARYPSAAALRRDLEQLLPSPPPRLDEWVASVVGQDVVAAALLAPTIAHSDEPLPRPEPPLAPVAEPTGLLDGMATPHGVTPMPARPPRGGQRALVGAVVGALVVFAVAGLAWSSLRDPPPPPAPAREDSPPTAASAVPTPAPEVPPPAPESPPVAPEPAPVPPAQPVREGLSEAQPSPPPPSGAPPVVVTAPAPEEAARPAPPPRGEPVKARPSPKPTPIRKTAPDGENPVHL